MKKFLSLIICLVLILSFPVTAFAEGGTASLSGVPTDIKKDVTATITVNVNGSPSMSSAFVQVTLGNGLELVSGEWVKEGVIKDFTVSKGYGVIAFSSAERMEGTVFSFVVKGKTVSKIAQNIKISLTFKNGSTVVGTVSVIKTVKVSCTRHTYSNYTNVNATNHSRTCLVCGDIETEVHSWNSGSVTKTAGCKEAGNTHYTCTATGCGATKDVPIEKTNNHTYLNGCDKTCNVCNAIREISHNYKTITLKATLKSDGSIVKNCIVCGDIYSKKAINKIDAVKLSTTKYTYNGKTKKPSVKIYDSKGNKISSSDYTVSYKDNKKVGKATVTIKLKGKYSGTLTAYFTIVPKESKVEKLTAAKKSLKVKLKKVSSESSGYEIQYSTSSKFSSKYTKTKKVTSYKTTSVTLKSLKAKKTYYVRVRTFKKVDGKTYYSSWSSAKYKKTK